MFIIVKIIYDSGKSFQIQDGCKYLDFDRFCNESGSDYIQKVHISVLKMTEQYKLTNCVRLKW